MAQSSKKWESVFFVPQYAVFRRASRESDLMPKTSSVCEPPCPGLGGAKTGGYERCAVVFIAFQVHILDLSGAYRYEYESQNKRLWENAVTL